MWPMSSIKVTQNFGSNTCYNYMYGGKAHPALDLVGVGDLSVRAVADGQGYFCRNCLGDGGNGVFIFHSDGYMTLYWHLK
jgi:murein DD-endopeptidase MepM/ murein hydrolase activator NlpD